MYLYIFSCSPLPRLKAADFIAGNKAQLQLLHNMGIRIATMADGRIQLLHSAADVSYHFWYTNFHGLSRIVSNHEIQNSVNSCHHIQFVYIFMGYRKGSTNLCIDE